MNCSPAQLVFQKPFVFRACFPSDGVDSHTLPCSSYRTVGW